MSVRLFVGNLPYEVTEADLKEFFSPVGPLSYVYIPVDRETGRQRGFAFVELAESAQAEDAIQRFNNQAFKGRTVTVKEARAREDRSRSGSPVRPFYRPPSGPSFRSANTGPDRSADVGLGGLQSRPEGRNRNFGPDARSGRKRRIIGRGAESERGPKRRPIRERSGGRIYGIPDDGLNDESLEDENPLASIAGAEEEDRE